MKKLLFSVTIKDCRVDTFTVSGHGGSGKDTSNTGVRITHLASGAVGRAVDGRSQWKNKQLAFRRMAETSTFRKWLKIEAAKRQGLLRDVEQDVERLMGPENLKTEKLGPKGWEPYE